jgi:hypothetical protein
MIAQLPTTELSPRVACIPITEQSPTCSRAPGQMADDDGTADGHRRGSVYHHPVFHRSLVTDGYVSKSL